ncbi:hypothetical protein B0H13DRAFT_1635176 [Mycena leptocephala]|nr:hypothetical protein B0H13DRAFT_1635176 [Mycena leptocephala]
MSVAHHGVVLFTDQDIDHETQRELGRRLGELAGKPATSTLRRPRNSPRTFR